MIDFELDYIELINKVYNEDNLRKTRNGETYSIFGETIKFDANIIPILAGRKIFYKGVFGELAAMLLGPTCIQDFKDQGCNYWDQWAEEDGTIKLDYGNAWLDFNGVNQLDILIQELKTNPTSRRLLISGWNPGNLDSLSLPCCHYAYQFYVDKDRLSIVWTQRSVDVMVGLPADALLAYALLRVIARAVGYKLGEATMNFGDTHIYKNHIVGMKKYLKQTKVIEDSITSLSGDSLKDWVILGYKPQPAIKFKVSL